MSGLSPASYSRSYDRYCKELGGPEVKEQLLSQIRQSVQDKSWRVRYMVANHFVKVMPYSFCG
jgi:hypothetical protein